tara:strand:- start:290 stop:754 length:465 start_codon:yes stop_codon:yes gene_type:complete
MDKNIVETFIKENENEDWSEEHKNIIKYVCYKTNNHPKNVVEILRLNGGNYKKIIREYQENELIEIVMRQTDYDRENAYLKLKEFNGDYEKVIKNYLGIQNKDNNDEISDKTTNQKIFNHIRDFMDNSKIEKEKIEYNNKKNEIITHLTKNALK